LKRINQFTVFFDFFKQSEFFNVLNFFKYSLHSFFFTKKYYKLFQRSSHVKRYIENERRKQIIEAFITHMPAKHVDKNAK